MRLEEIYQKFDACKRCCKAKNPLQHILGGGKTRQPDFAFVLINPTYRNLSAHKKYKGKRRYPNIGVKHFWRILAEGGFVDKKLVGEIGERGWEIADENRIEASLKKHSVYLTNIVKCAESHGDNPSAGEIKEQQALLWQELALVEPRHIVAFGILPIKTLTGRSVRLRDLECKGYQPIPSLLIMGKRYPVLPCYFPIGRGNPKKAVEILRCIKRKFRIRG